MPMTLLGKDTATNYQPLGTKGYVKYKPYLLEDRTMRTNLKWIAAVTIGLFVVVSLLGCNTIKGAGKDIERAGEVIQDAAD